MRYLLLSLMVVGLVSPAWADTGWYRGPATTAQELTQSRNLSAGETVYWIHADAAGGGAEAITDSVFAMGISNCPSITIAYCQAVGGGAETAAEYYYMGAATSTKTNPRTILVDVDGGGVDEITANGDCGRDEDNDGTSEQRSIYWGFSPLDRYIWFDEVVAPGDGTTAIISLTCNVE